MLHTPDGGVVSPEFEDLDRKLRNGDGMMWPGDSRMWLGIGVLENRVTKKVGKRLEVWRDNEDGTTTLIAHWLLNEQFRVIYDLAQMRMDRPGYVSVEDRIDTHNDALEKAALQKAAEARIELLDHALHLQHDRNEPKTRFYQGDKPDLPTKPAAPPPEPPPAEAT